MKSVLISYNQALSDRIMNILDRQNVRGFTRWALTEGRGSKSGEPHYGSHTWPAMNSTILAVVEDRQVQPLMQALRELDAVTEMQGLRAFVWSVEDQL